MKKLILAHVGLDTFWTGVSPNGLGNWGECVKKKTHGFNKATIDQCCEKESTAFPLLEDIHILEFTSS